MKKGERHCVVRNPHPDRPAFRITDSWGEWQDCPADQVQRPRPMLPDPIDGVIGHVDNPQSRFGIGDQKPDGFVKRPTLQCKQPGDRCFIVGVRGDAVHRVRGKPNHSPLGQEVKGEFQVFFFHRLECWPLATLDSSLEE